MDTKQILNELEALVDSGTKVPGFRGKVMIESVRLSQLAQAIESGMPADIDCLLYTSPRPRDATLSRMPSSA